MVDVRKLEVRDEVRSLRYEPAVDLGEVARGEAPPFIQDPAAFFERTYLTGKMKELIIKVIMNLIGLERAVVDGREYRVSGSFIVLPSDLGGGKTHSLILLYHVLTTLSRAKSREEAVSQLSRLDKGLARFISEYWDEIRGAHPRVVVADCKYSDMAPGPIKLLSIGGARIRTLWGYIAYQLGRYEEIRGFDESGNAPYVDDLVKVLSGSGAVVLIDEIGRYYDQSGLEPTTISAFLMNLTEAMLGSKTPGAVVVISMPYESKGKGLSSTAEMSYIHRPDLVAAINKVLSREKVEIIKPVEKGDLAEILRRRIFAHSRREFQEMIGDFIASELNREYPEQVRRIIDGKKFWKEVESTFPFHPAFIDLLENLAYKLPYLQRTRDAIKIAVQSVLALKSGLYDALEDAVRLIMPYHIPVFVNEVLDETILRNAPDEYKVFLIILKSNVLVPHNLEELEGIGRKEFLEKVASRHLRELREDDAILAVKLAIVIWLHSLIGLGLPANMGDYPSTSDLIYSVSPTEEDVKGVLSIIRNVLPQLIVHGDPDSDRARWFFARIPSIEELIEIRKRNVTDEMAKDQLKNLLETGLQGHRGRSRRVQAGASIFSKSTFVVKKLGELPGEALSFRDPTLVILADSTSRGELEAFMNGRNNVVVLAPHVEGVEEERLAPEDVKGIPELAGMQGRSAWDGLLELLRYYSAVNSIEEDDLKRFLIEQAGGEEEYARDVLNILSSKIQGKREYYYRHVWNMINRAYRRVYYYRNGTLLHFSGLTLEIDKPIPPIVEELLRDRDLIPDEFIGEDLLNIIRTYMGIEPEENPINVGNVWQFLVTTSQAMVPIISYNMLVDAVKDLLRSRDYLADVKGALIWKPVYNSLEEARAKDEGERIVRDVESALRRLGASWDEATLVYWKKRFKEWLEKIRANIPEDKVLEVLDVASGAIRNVDDIKFGLENIVKNGRLFLEERKYKVNLDLELPEEVREGKSYSIPLTLDVEGYEGELTLKISGDEALNVEPREIKGEPPIREHLKLEAVKAGTHNIIIEVYGDGELLDTRLLSIEVKGSVIEATINPGDDTSSLQGAVVVMVEAFNLQGLNSIVRLSRIYPGRITGTVSLTRGDEEIRLTINTEDYRVVEQLRSTIRSLISLLGGAEKEVNKEVNIEYTPREEPTLASVEEKLLSRDGLRLIVRVREG